MVGKQDVLVKEEPIEDSVHSTVHVSSNSPPSMELRR